MSPTENPIIVEPHSLVRQPDGLATWRPHLTVLTVLHVGDSRHIVFTDDGEERLRFRLSPADVAHLVALLRCRPDREAAA